MVIIHMKPIKKVGNNSMIKLKRLTVIALAATIVTAIFMAACSGDNNEADVQQSSSYIQEETSDTSGGDIQITVADVTSAATFYDTAINGFTVEIFAVRASDDTVRVAFNTCRVCNGSKKAYFVQSGSYMVCQNCKSKISIDTVGKSSNSCSPVPVTSYSSGNGIITVSQNYLEGNVSLFKKWKDN